MQVSTVHSKYTISYSPDRVFLASRARDGGEMPSVDSVDTGHGATQISHGWNGNPFPPCVLRHELAESGLEELSYSLLSFSIDKQAGTHPWVCVGFFSLLT